jgi:hypothetical protein
MMPPSAVGQVVLLIATVWLAERSRRAKLGFRFGTYAISINEFKGRKTLA